MSKNYTPPLKDFTGIVHLIGESGNLGKDRRGKVCLYNGWVFLVTEDCNKKWFPVDKVKEIEQAD